MAEFAYDKPKARSRILLLSYLAQFSLARQCDGHVFGGVDGSFTEAGFRGEAPAVGDLVALRSAPPSKFYLSWFVSKQIPEGWSDHQYTLESIEDGELCNWTNVGFAHYDRKDVANHPEWRWSDAQHAFYDRWKNVCFKERDAYIILPVQPVFDGEAVTLATRVRHSFHESRSAPRTFPNWRRVTKADMREYYDKAVAADQKSVAA